MRTSNFPIFDASTRSFRVGEGVDTDKLIPNFRISRSKIASVDRGSFPVHRNQAVAVDPRCWRDGVAPFPNSRGYCSVPREGMLSVVEEEGLDEMLNSVFSLGMGLAMKILQVTLLLQPGGIPVPNCDLAPEPPSSLGTKTVLWFLRQISSSLVHLYLCSSSIGRDTKHKKSRVRFQKRHVNILHK